MEGQAMTKYMTIVLDGRTDEIKRSTVRNEHDAQTGNIDHIDFQELRDFLDHSVPYGQWSFDITSNECDDIGFDSYGYETVSIQVNLDVKKCSSMVAYMKHKAAQELWKEDATSKLAYRRLHDEMEEIYQSNGKNINDSWKHLHKISGDPELTRDYINTYKENMNE